MGRRSVATAVVAVAAMCAIVGGGHVLGRQTADQAGIGPAPNEAGSPHRELDRLRRSVPPPAPMTPPPPTALPPTAPPVLVAAAPGPYGSRQMTGTAGVALTFDDGPDPHWTPVVLDLLRHYGVRATFCLIGVNARAFPGLVRRIVSEGHTLCNHSWGHEVALGTWSTDEIHRNLTRTNDEIRRTLPGVPIPYFRHPGGAWTPRAVQVAASLGMASIHWDVDPKDWSRPGAGTIAQTINSVTRAGSIVLLHDGGGDRSGTVTACRFFLPYLRARFSLMALPTPPTNGHGRGRFAQAD